MRSVSAAALGLGLLLAGCADEGLSSEDAATLARTRIAAAANVPADALQVDELFVGEREDDLHVCGTVEGGGIAPRRFIVANDPARVVMFERAGEIGQQGAYDFNLEWHLTCAPEAALPG